MNGRKIYKKKLLDLLSPIENLNIIEWSEKYIDCVPDSPFTGKLNLHRTPFLIEPLKGATARNTSLCVMNFPVQFGKSLILKLLALYQITNDPSPILFLTDTPANSEDFCDTSLIPMLKNNKIFDGLISSSTGANMKETKIFSNGAILWNRGASNLKNLQRRSVKLLLADECWLYPPTHLEEAIKRITRFSDDGGRAILVSQAGELNGEFNQYFSQTNQQEYMWRCEECKNMNPYDLSMISWDDTLRDDQDSIKTDEAINTLLYVCPHCGHTFPATKENLSKLNETSKWIAQNEHAAEHSKGYHTTAFCFMSAADLLTEYIQARNAARDGDFSKMRIFYQKRLAQPWTEQYEAIDTHTQEVTGQNFGSSWEKMGFISTDGKLLPPDASELKKETLKGALPLIFMGLDVQQDSFYYVIRAFSQDPQQESMLIECGRLFSWADVFAKRSEYHIPNSNMGIDSGFRSKEIYAVAVENRCFALKGHSQRSFKREVPNTIGRKIYESHAVAAPQAITIQATEQGKPKMMRCFLISFSANAGKDWIFFNRQRTQKGKAHYDTPTNTPPEYEEQMNSEKRIQENRSYVWRKRKSHIDNHFLDCESMIYALLLNLMLSRGNYELEEYIL